MTLRIRNAGPGFSLIELLVVLLIMALAAAVVMPRLGVGAGAEARAEARRLGATLRAARGEAIAAQRTVRVLVDVERRRYQLETAAPVQLPVGTEIKFVADPAGILDARTGELRFFPDGSASGAEIRLQAPGGSYRIAINWLTGRVRVDG